MISSVCFIPFCIQTGDPLIQNTFPSHKYHVLQQRSPFWICRLENLVDLFERPSFGLDETRVSP